MGFKFFHFHQLIPTCFNLLNTNSHVSFTQPNDQPPSNPNRPLPRRKKRQIKVMTSNGVVLLYTKPIRASKLMHELPTHLLCRSDSFYIGQNILPLNPKTKLKLSHNYFLLPKPYFQSTLTFASFAAAASALWSTKLVNSSCKAFSIEKGRNGYLRIRVSDEFIELLCTEQRRTMEFSGEEKERVCNSEQLMKDYKLLVGKKKEWSPKLERIEEKDKPPKFRAFRRKRGMQRFKGLVLSQFQRSQILSVKWPRLKKNKVVKLRM